RTGRAGNAAAPPCAGCGARTAIAGSLPAPRVRPPVPLASPALAPTRILPAQRERALPAGAQPRRGPLHTPVVPAGSRLPDGSSGGRARYTPLPSAVSRHALPGRRLRVGLCSGQLLGVRPRVWFGCTSHLSGLLRAGPC